MKIMRHGHLASGNPSGQMASVHALQPGRLGVRSPSGTFMLCHANLDWQWCSAPNQYCSCPGYMSQTRCATGITLATLLNPEQQHVNVIPIANHVSRDIWSHCPSSLLSCWHQTVAGLWAKACDVAPFLQTQELAAFGKSVKSTTGRKIKSLFLQDTRWKSILTRK